MSDRSHDWSTRAASIVICLSSLVCLPGPPSAADDADGALPDSTPRSLAVALTLDRDAVSLHRYTYRDVASRVDTRLPDPVAYEGTGPVQLEIVLASADGRGIARRTAVRGLCLDHGPDEPAHVEGDTIRLHRESLTFDLPDLPGFDRIEVAYHRHEAGTLRRRVIGRVALSHEKQMARPAPGFGVLDPGYEPGPQAGPPTTSGSAAWPEDFGDTETYLVWGAESETSKRINIVLVPDGYVYAEKALMETHAQSLVDHFRQKTPYAEHDSFINYILVYAYSGESGTDQCDCGIVRNTAMNTRFPDRGYPCGDSGNRCLYYGSSNGGPACDPDVSATNIVTAELRAPAHDQTVVMVNTTRYGGCGGARAVYAAGNASATEIAVHELGHSLAGLADEYTSYTTCGFSAGEINTSLDSTDGAWPEWVGDLGAPVEGAQYYPTCVYRPTASCNMRTLNTAFCPVCNQHWALTFFGHPRVAPTAPVESFSPASPVTAQVGKTVSFGLATRLATNTTNDITWEVDGPGYAGPTVVATGVESHDQSFAQTGTYSLTAEVVADTNFIKPSKNGANVGSAGWTIDAVSVPEVSAAGAPSLDVERNGSLVNLLFADTGSDRYNVYVSTSPGTSPFLVSSPSEGKTNCDVQGLVENGDGRLRLDGYDPDAGLTASGPLRAILVTADNGAGTEGPLGDDSGGSTRSADSRCAL